MTLGDLPWVGIGAVAALLAVPVAVGLFLLGRARRTLDYDVLLNSALLSLREERISEIQVMHKGEVVRGVRVIEVAVHNSGNQPITASDVEEPISIRPQGAARVLNAEIVGVIPTSLRPELYLEHGAVMVKPVLLNPDDLLVAKIVTAEGDGAVTVSGRIVGVSDIRKSSLPLGGRIWNAVWTGGFAVVLLYLGGIAVFVPSEGMLSNAASRWFWIVVGGGGGLALIVNTISSLRPYGEGDSRAKRRSRML